MDGGSLATGHQFKTKSGQWTNPGGMRKSKDWENTQSMSFLLNLPVNLPAKAKEEHSLDFAEVKKFIRC